MKKEERLFAALSGVSDELLERSERRKTVTGRWIAWGAALAACLAVVLVVHSGMGAKGNDLPPAPPHIGEDIPTYVQKDPPADENEPNPAQPAKAERLHLLQICMDQKRRVPRFTIWYNEESYYAFQQGEIYTIKPRDPPNIPGEELPECKLEIEYRSGPVDEIAEEVLGQLKGLYRSAEEDDYPVFPEGTRYFRAGNGTDWNAAQREVWLLPWDEDGAQAGAFVCSASYFLEAEEGHGIRFLDMVRSFRIAEENGEDSLPWMSSAFDAAFRMLEAVMSDDLASVEDMLAPGADVYGYGENVYGSVSAGSHIAISPSGDYDPEISSEPPAALNVSVQFRLGGEDSYSYLTMEMIYQDGAWLAEWIGIEK